MKSRMIHKIDWGLTYPQIRRKYGNGSWITLAQNNPLDAYNLFYQAGVADLGRAILVVQRERKNFPIDLIKKVKTRLEDLNSLTHNSMAGSKKSKSSNEEQEMDWRQSNVWDNGCKIYEKNKSNGNK
ncbi:hypothetical protein HN832_01480 [archaeon]|jgi:hypothetical protein|nr:hypothetical protein [archaeon]MBT4373945.1 hypothetical protein [archaeon]MBT4532338.1 hypothetical protein [archaeon]MBT7001924.1 hypothetical protein [archaeon]MBT7282063.1 hypothetical protein [archaeon]